MPLDGPSQFFLQSCFLGVVFRDIAILQMWQYFFLTAEQRIFFVLSPIMAAHPANEVKLLVYARYSQLPSNSTAIKAFPAVSTSLFSLANLISSANASVSYFTFVDDVEITSQAIRYFRYMEESLQSRVQKTILFIVYQSTTNVELLKVKQEVSLQFNSLMN